MLVWGSPFYTCFLTARQSRLRSRVPSRCPGFPRARLIGYTAPMPFSRRAQLSLMMFLNYVVWGSWYVTLGTYLTATLHFTGTETGAVFGTTALASIISPFFVGMIADRFFSTEKVLAALHLVGAVLLYLVTQVSSFGAIYTIMLAYCLCYFPTIAL